MNITERLILKRGIFGKITLGRVENFPAFDGQIACQDLLPPKRRIFGRYGTEIETF